MNTHSKIVYQLEKYAGPGSRYTCPNCGRKGEFTRYVDTRTGRHVDATCGKCNRESNCGYHLKPSELKGRSSRYYQEYKPTAVNTANSAGRITPPALISYYSKESLQKTLGNYEKNKLVLFLAEKYGEEVAAEMISKYFIGTHAHWDGATVFWQIDAKGIIRGGKVMLYDEKTGKRVKEPYNHVTWMHAIEKKVDYNLQQCLFGEHQLSGDLKKAVAIVESEKTAIIAAVFMHQYIWLACGGLNAISAERLKALTGRTILLYPDAKAYDKWKEKMKKLPATLDVRISDLLETRTTEEEKAAGLDIADFLIKYKPKNINEYTIENIQIEKTVTEEPEKIRVVDDTEFAGICAAIRKYKNYEPRVTVFTDWADRIAAVVQAENLFLAFTGTIRLDAATVVVDVPKFYVAHIAFVFGQQGNSTYLSYLERLEAVQREMGGICT